MTITTLSGNRAKLTKKIFTYTKRRDTYRKKVNNLTNLIKGAAKQVKTVDEEKKIIVAHRKAVSEFTGIPLKAIRKDRKNLSDMELTALGIYFKYGAEHGMQARHLIEHLGNKRAYQCTEYRTWFTESFQTNPQNREAFYNFKKYIS